MLDPHAHLSEMHIADEQTRFGTVPAEIGDALLPVRWFA